MLLHIVKNNYPTIQHQPSLKELRPIFEDYEKKSRTKFNFLSNCIENKKCLSKKLAYFVVNKTYRHAALIQLPINSIKRYNGPKSKILKISKLVENPLN